MMFTGKMNENDFSFLMFPALLALFAVFNPISSVKAVSRRTFGKWRYLVYPTFILAHGLAAAFDPILVILLSVMFPGALDTFLETYYFMFRRPDPPAQSSSNVSLGIDGLQSALSFIKESSPSISEFALVIESLYGFETAYAALTSPLVRLGEDGRLRCIELKEPDFSDIID